MSKSSPARRARMLARKRHSSSVVQSVRPKDPKPLDPAGPATHRRYDGLYVGGMADYEPYGGSEAVKPTAPGVRLHVSVALELAAYNASSGSGER